MRGVDRFFASYGIIHKKGGFMDGGGRKRMVFLFLS